MNIEQGMLDIECANGECANIEGTNSIKYPASSIQHQVSSIKYPASSLPLPNKILPRRIECINQNTIFQTERTVHHIRFYKISVTGF